MINSLQGSYRFLSNFYPCKIYYDGVSYQSTESAYQAHKTLDLKERKKFSKIKSPSYAKRLGRKLKLRSDWERIKFSIMKDLLRIKFSNRELRDELLETGFDYLEERNTWHDVCFGVCEGGCGEYNYEGHPLMGQNYLGKLLMEVREEIRADLTEDRIRDLEANLT